MKPVSALDVVTEVKDLFSLPDIYFQLNQMVRDPRYSMVDIGEVIGKDPALSARLLKLVNSSFYGFQSKVDTISRAISIVGIDDLYNLVVATCVVDRFSKIPSDLVDMTAFWMRSVHCGVVTKLLGKQCASLNTERLFLAGLLHDIGSLVLYQIMPEQASQVLLSIRQDRRLLGGFEQEIIGFTHADVGRELLKSWHLPDSLHEVVGGILNPDVVATHKFDAQLLWLTARLIDDREFGRPIEQTLVELPDQTLVSMRLTREQIESVMEQAAVEFLDVFEQLLPR
ncbi:MAG: HDOD domain-containing protein [Methylomonas sp.]|jgi:HD-like signal output (HDOD) protein|uniref:HDOD domain-containing protein n=1 Tax=Methylomonas sp. TaxID=418 RepID=UPI0025E53A3F|nr:HDOD domain-containing protein [Methylomonas sp.]MCK9606516.1 HDOD domain-containing protein [Methylomonas sp.]